MLLTQINIKHFRGIKELELCLDETTVLIGENNSGKTSILHALKACLNGLRSGGRRVPFDEFDLHFEDVASDPTTAPPIEIILTFEERGGEEWDSEMDRILGGNKGVIALIPPEDRARIKLRVQASYSETHHEMQCEYDFLNESEQPLPLEHKHTLSALQQVRPLFYLSALRDAAKEFSRNAQFWSSFVKNSSIDADTKGEIEAKLKAINEEIIHSHGSFKTVRDHLAKVQDLVALGGDADVVSVDALPAKVFDMLNRTQINIASATGAKIPILRHGEGTQSLSVLMLFDAFLKTELVRKQGLVAARPIIALEEPEAHLHPSAIRSLCKTIKEIEGQKIIASHSGDLLSEVELSSIRRIYKDNGAFKVGVIPSDLFDTRNRRKFEFAIKRTRAELFFARTWLLGEGETESLLLTAAAQIMGIDLEQEGIRLIEHRIFDINNFFEAANHLGICWHLFSDADQAGRGFISKAQTQVSLNGWATQDHITSLTHDHAIETYLSLNGFCNVYENYANEKEIRQKISVEKTHPDYPIQLASCVKQKIEAAHAVVEAMTERGESSIPSAIRSALEESVKLARRYC